MTAPQHLILDAGAVSRLNWQPRRCPPPLKCIASRRGDVVELIFHPGYDPASRPLSGHLHRYRIEPLTETTVLATLIEPAETATTTEGKAR